ncbi:hypothetical protein PWT90_04691 [Aphanocladium album]|nr:hypothetical protein PWT90_04691 [Aphanocladium album]
MSGEENNIAEANKKGPATIFRRAASLFKPRDTARESKSANSTPTTGIASSKAEQHGSLTTHAKSASTDLRNMNPSPPQVSERLSSHGLVEIVSQSSDSSCAVDIIAIHGLNGHLEKTWTSKRSGLNWLKDSSCLPNDIGNARVFSFGYNAASYFCRANPDVCDFASELLASIQSSRRSLIERQRPIIFLCHSLGGLVFKQAMIRAHEQTGFYSSLLSNVRGVVFFATPHRGSDLAYWDSLVGRLISAATLSYTKNAHLSRTLRVDSDRLKHISDAFAYRGWTFQIRSFYETEFMPGLNCRVVDKDSAILGWGNELDIASPANHSEICKFDSPDESRYRIVISIISDMVASLSSGGLPHNPAPGSCEWILSHRAWKQWQKLQSSSLLWISSNAGCGKSVMAKFLVEHFRTAQNVRRFRNFGYFFFMEGISGQDNAASALSALLYQLFFSQRELMEKLSIMNDAIDRSRVMSVSRLWPIVSDAISDDNTKDILWVLDGLDECESTSLKTFLDKVAGFLKAHNSGKDGERNKACLKIILLSRPSSLIQGALRLHLDGGPSDHSSSYKIRLAMEDENAALLGDIVRFARWKIDELACTSALPAHALERLRERLVIGADFTFLWISLVIKVIEDAILNGISIQSLEAILETNRLDDVYQHLLERPCRSLPSKTRRLLSILLVSPQPPTIDEMCVAIEVDTHYEVIPRKKDTLTKNNKATVKLPNKRGPKSWRAFDTERRMKPLRSLKDIDEQLHKPFDNHVRQLCGHFVRIRSQRLYLVHQTARDFLMKASFSLGHTILPRQDAKALPLPQPSHTAEDDSRVWQPIKLNDAIQTALKICVTFIEIFSLETYGMEENGSGENSKTCLTRCFMKYAALNWISFYRPVRKSLNFQYDEMLQPGTPVFESWAKFHDSWSSTHHQEQDTPGAIWIAGKQRDTFEKNEDGTIADSDITKLSQLHGRFAKIDNWLRGTWYCTSNSPTVELRAKQVSFRHTLWSHHSFQSLYSYFNEGWRYNIGSRQEFAEVEKLLTVFETTKASLIQKDNDLQLIGVDPRECNSIAPFTKLLRASNTGPVKERRLLESLLHFDLFDPKESVNDDFLCGYGESRERAEARERSQQEDRESGSRLASYKTEDAMPDWIKHYIRQRSEQGRGTPGVNLPEQSNPENKTFDDSMAILLRSSKKPIEIFTLRK